LSDAAQMFTGHTEKVTSIDIKNGFVLSASMLDQSVRLYFEDGKCISSLHFESKVTAIALDPKLK